MIIEQLGISNGEGYQLKKLETKFGNFFEIVYCFQGVQSSSLYGNLEDAFNWIAHFESHYNIDASRYSGVTNNELEYIKMFPDISDVCDLLESRLYDVA